MPRPKNDKPWRDQKPRYEKNPTTNAKMDPHKVFCRRCIVYNHGCPNPGGPKNCNL